jgi:hypothetical protein
VFGRYSWNEPENGQTKFPKRVPKGRKPVWYTGSSPFVGRSGPWAKTASEMAEGLFSKKGSPIFGPVPAKTMKLAVLERPLPSFLSYIILKWFEITL